MRLYDIMMSETTLIVRMNIGEWDRQLGPVEEDYCAPLATQLLSVFLVNDSKAGRCGKVANSVETKDVNILARCDPG